MMGDAFWLAGLNFFSTTTPFIDPFWVHPSLGDGWFFASVWGEVITGKKGLIRHDGKCDAWVVALSPRHDGPWWGHPG